MSWAVSDNVRRLRRKSIVGQLVLLVLGVQLMVFASFTCLQLPTATARNLDRFITIKAQQMLVYAPPRWQYQMTSVLPALKWNIKPVRVSPYVPLVPTAIFVGYIFGTPLGVLTVFTYFALGLAGPLIGILPFAEGGGPDYFRQPTFGYLLGGVIGAWLAGRVTFRVSSLRQLVAVLGGVLLTHGFGLAFLVGGSLGLLVFYGDAFAMKWQPWLFETVRNLSWYTLPYDLLFSLGLVGVGFPFRWLTEKLTAPDITGRPKPRFDRTLEQVS